MRNLIVMLFLFIVTLSCVNSNEQNVETEKTIIFGEVYGNCAGD